MLLRRGLLAMLLAASTAAAAQTGAGQPPGTEITNEMLQPQPLDQTPTLRAPGSAEDLITLSPYPMPPQAAPVLPAPLIEQPTADAEPVTAEPVRQEAVVPRPEPRPKPKRREASRPEPPEPQVRAKSQVRAESARFKAPDRVTTPARVVRGRISVRSRSAGRPLNIVPPLASTNPAPLRSQTTDAFVPERRLQAIPWPFALPRRGSQFNVPGGLW